MQYWTVDCCNKTPGNYIASGALFRLPVRIMLLICQLLLTYFKPLLIKKLLRKENPVLYLSYVTIMLKLLAYECLEDYRRPITNLAGMYISIDLRLCCCSALQSIPKCNIVASSAFLLFDGDGEERLHRRERC